MRRQKKAAFWTVESNIAKMCKILECSKDVEQYQVNANRLKYVHW